MREPGRPAPAARCPPPRPGRSASGSSSSARSRSTGCWSPRFKVSHELLASPPTFWPHEWDLRAYRKLFYETNFWTYFQNTWWWRR